MIFILNQLTGLVEKEKQVLTLADIQRILHDSTDLHAVGDSVAYSGLVTAHWSFILAVCNKYVR